MEVIYLHHPYAVNQIKKEPVVLAMGFFDGVHAGHRMVIKRAAEEAKKRGIKLAVLTYDHHPSIVFKTYNKPLTYLTRLPKKLALLAELGVDLTYVVNFTSEFAQLTPQIFVDQYMFGLHAEAVVAGFDHTYGPKNADMKHLPQYSQSRFDVIEVQQVNVDGKESASTTARKMVDEGRLDTLTHLLMRPYETTGLIVHGEARGRELGYPTANIETTPGERLPGVGVYVVEMKIDQTWYPGMASIGYNVTFGENRPKTVEINLFNFSRAIYGENVQIKWHHYLRGEVKFNNVQELIDQLAEDEKEAQAFLLNL
ncbi:riboflavin biosynthesis protein RibF [Weissella paramesenteroides]|uniref:riboflavin biosynthesis protein RibF n=1 Tax=Weissella paramesenteroides TaxID=1249 RepID=UPI002073972F|nr:riboflavin biosynthesis protein RibF [Weissella paramesenteroides]MCM6765793.1 riboflavin biosynthesis protein RibF [Weissella paramesenteroides]MCM6767165.1 riboflavin biosynthesis protein RibF [Weissella paramesenteroides]MCM6769467.1 riboflavin biosynthesis protein RibF [Weissella paramesenteroides]MCM6771072.1 riboflavin biosynthesis protein RibF [Weissella paramesenteroides]MCM6779836.1 riboflavin biosynthesis protein RibF [Weissella paramesenteroides]